VTDTFPAVCTVTYSSVAAGGATGNSGDPTPASGNISDTLSLPAGSSVTYTADCAIDSGATGTLDNTATVVGGVTDPDTSNDSAEDSDTLTASADLTITKDDGVIDAPPGDPVTYTITVTNVGPSDSAGTVADVFPAMCTSVTYTSVVSGGATGNTATGTGNINDALTLPAGSTVTYTATCTVDEDGSGTLTNTATITASGVTDPDTDNNSATDEDHVGNGLFNNGFEPTDTDWNFYEPST